VTKQELHAPPSSIKVGQKQASSRQEVAAELMVEQIGHLVGLIAGRVVTGISVGNSDSQPLITEPKTAASVTFTVRRQLLQAGPSATAVGQKQASSAQDVAADPMIAH
jgi:hypothetical protein